MYPLSSLPFLSSQSEKCAEFQSNIQLKVLFFSPILSSFLSLALCLCHLPVFSHYLPVFSGIAFQKYYLHENPSLRDCFWRDSNQKISASHSHLCLHSSCIKFIIGFFISFAYSFTHSLRQLSLNIRCFRLCCR